MLDKFIDFCRYKKFIKKNIFIEISSKNHTFVCLSIHYMHIIQSEKKQNSRGNKNINIPVSPFEYFMIFIIMCFYM